jgi:hypothetical protein
MLSRFFVYLYILVFKIKSVKRIKGRRFLLSIDDFPKSSVSGLPLRFRKKTTYFISGGLVNTNLYGSRMFTVSDLKEIYEAGCHSYNHICCRSVSNHQINESLRRNERFLNDYALTSRVGEVFSPMVFGLFELLARSNTDFFLVPIY